MSPRTWLIAQKTPLSILIPLLCAVGAAAAGCGGGGIAGITPTGNGDPGNADSKAGIVGSWVGTFELKSDDKDADEESTSARATFKRTSDEKEGLAGTFSVDLPDRDQAAITGTFKDFAGETLMLTVKTSTISSIGTAGSGANLDYDLIGTSLRLQNDRVLMKLVRGTNPDGTDGDGGDGDTEPQTGLPGYWVCRDANGYDWMFDLTGESTFSVNVIDANGKRPALGMNGALQAVTGDPGLDVQLTVTSADLAKYEGLGLTAKLVDANNLKVTRQDTQESLACSRK